MSTASKFWTDLHFAMAKKKYIELNLSRSEAVTLRSLLKNVNEGQCYHVALGEPRHTRIFVTLQQLKKKLKEKN